MRRHDREVTSWEEKLAILNRCDVIRIGFSASTTPYIVPMHFCIFVKDNALTLCLHGALQGRKMDLLTENSVVSFEADRLLRTYGEPGGLACIWSADFESVMGVGALRLVEQMEEKQSALDALMLRYGFEGTPKYAPGHLNAVAVLALEVTELTGKAKLS